jgi:hypothetical protein
LLSALKAIETKSLDLISSGVVAFNGDCDDIPRFLKLGTVRKFDHIFQSGGAGMTFTFNRKVAESFIMTYQPKMLECRNFMHDWELYYFCRIAGYRVLLDTGYSVFYRQHRKNALGANIGFSALLRRLVLIFDSSSSFRSQLRSHLSAEFRSSINVSMLFQLRRSKIQSAFFWTLLRFGLLR